MNHFSSDPRRTEATSAETEERSSSVQVHHHDESEGSEFLDDALRMKEQLFENGSTDNKEFKKQKN